jgi:hypothetical protein
VEHTTHDWPVVLRALRGVTLRPREGTGARGRERLCRSVPRPKAAQTQRASPLTLMGVVGSG